MLRVEERIELNRPAEIDDSVVLPYELRQRSRFRAKTQQGVDIGVFLPRGTILRHDDVLRDERGLLIKVLAQEEDVSEVVCTDIFRLARAAYHLGNRHVPLQIGQGWLRYQPDHVLDDMVSRLGLTVENCKRVFQPESGAYSHSEDHKHGVPHAHNH